MKKLFLLTGLLSIGLLSSADAQVTPIVPSTTTCSGLTVAVIPTSLNLPLETTIALPTYVTIQNQSTINPIFCGDSSGVSTTGGTGFEIGPGSNFEFTLPQSEQFYCIAPSASVQATICQTK